MKFLATLKDSFREAVDGWVIYVMLGMSSLLILLVACVGYRQVDADKAFASIVGSFHAVQADYNRSTFHQQFLFGVTFDLAEVKALTEARRPHEADYELRLQVLDSYNAGPPPIPGLAPAGPPPAPKKTGNDPGDSALRRAVAFWASPGGRGASAADARAVTDEQINAFIKDMFQFNGNVDVSDVRPVKTDDPNKYEFVIRTKGQDSPRGWPHEPSLLFGAITVPLELPLGKVVWFIQDGVVNGVGAWVTLLVSVVFTAFFIPNMMRKGSIDLLLSKPLNRATLLVYKYVGGLTFVFLNTAYAVGGVWLVMGLRSGVWSNGFLLTIFAITFYFAILYAVSTLLGVLTRNAIVAILGTVAFWFLMWVVGQVYGVLDLLRHEAAMKERIPKWVYYTADTANAILPRTSDLNKLTSKMVVQDTLAEGDKRRAKVDNLTWPSWGEVLGVSLAHIGIMLGLAVWRFATRDY